MTRKSKNTASSSAGSEQKTSQLAMLPFSNTETLLLFNKCRASAGTPPTELHLQRWSAVKRVNHDGYPTQLESVHDFVVPKAPGKPWYSTSVCKQSLAEYLAEQEKRKLQAQAQAQAPPLSTADATSLNKAKSLDPGSTRLGTSNPSLLKEENQVLSSSTTTVPDATSTITLSDLVRKVANMEEDQKKKTREIEELQAQLTTARENQTVLEGTNHRLEERLSSNDSTVAELQRIISDFESMIQQQETNARQREQEIGHRDEQIRLQEVTLGELNEKISELEGELGAVKDDSRSDRKSFALERDNHQREVGNLQDEIAKRAEAFEGLSQRLEKEHYAHSNERSSHKTTREFLEEVRQSNATYKDQITFQQAKIAELEESNASGRNMKKQNNALLEEQENFSIQVKALEEEVESLQHELEAAQAQAKEKVDDYDNLRAETRTLRSKVDEMDLEKSRFDRDRLNFQTQITTLQAQLAERSKITDTQDTSLFTSLAPTPPLLNRMNSLADELSGQSDEEEEEDEEVSLAETVLIERVEQETQTDPDPILTNYILTTASTAPIDAPAPPEPVPEPLTSSTILETSSSSAPIAAPAPPPAAPEALVPSAVRETAASIPVAATTIKQPVICIASNPNSHSSLYNTLFYIGAALCAILAILMVSQTIEYQAFNSPSPSTPLRILHATASPVISVFHTFPSARVLPIGFASTPLGRAGSHGLGSWAGGIFPVGFAESYFDVGWVFGEWMVRLERALGVDRAGLV